MKYHLKYINIKINTIKKTTLKTIVSLCEKSIFNNLTKHKTVKILVKNNIEKKGTR